jgi:acyl-CoA synthetase (NDP forming)
VCYAAGFAEMGGEGTRLQRDLVAAAGELALAGPNCYGVLNYLDGAALWADVEGGVRVDEGVAIVSQSGNISLNFTMAERSVPLAQVISVGNQAVLEIGDYIAPLVDDPRIKAIGLYIEGLRDVAGFSRAAEYALGRGVPLVGLKVGRSEAAQNIALSHTASLAGSDDVYDALFERLGIIRVPSLTAFLETLKLLAHSGPLAGRRLGVLTCSGGDAALVADLAQKHGLSIPGLSEQQSRVLSDRLPDFASIGNPLDYNTAIWGDREALEFCFTTLMGGGLDATLLVLDYPRPGLPDLKDWDNAIDALGAAAGASRGKGMVVASLPELLPAAARKRALDAGLVPLQGLEEAVTALAGAAWVHEQQQSKAAAAKAGRLALPAPAAVSGAGRLLDEWTGKQRLGAAGLTVPAGRLVAPGEAPAAASDIGFPVVVKACGEALAHKSEAGAVALGLESEAAVAAAVAGMAGLADRFLVEAMVRGVVAELIVGVKREPLFGPALVIGSGGVLVNLVEDTATLLLPTDRAAVARALDGLKVARLIAGYRGRPAGDRDATIDAILAIAAFAHGARDRLLELDVNPLMVLRRGAVAADVLIRFADPGKGDQIHDAVR